MKKRALISVFYKDGVIDLASSLVDLGWELLSTGGTSRHLKENGLPVTDVSSVTGFPECLDGRVKTLHPAVHAGILARRSEKSHMDTLDTLGLGTIDLVCVNLYPFFEKVKAGLSLEETVEFIDIGGPTMLRSAAKNYQDVVVLVDPEDYGSAIEGIKAGAVPMDLRKRLAGKVFDLTSAYDAAIARYLLDEEYPTYWPLSMKKAQGLRYGENGHQSAALYLSTDKVGALGAMEQLQGKELSYNNIRDLDLAWKAVRAFDTPEAGTVGTDPRGAVDADHPVACVAVKHNTPCGVALGATPMDAYRGAYRCDPVSIYGGIVTFNTVVDGSTAKELAELFLEIIVAPGFTDEALEVFKKKKNLRVLKAALAPKDPTELIAVDGGLLVQSADRRLLDGWNVVTKVSPPEEDIAQMLFGMRAVTYVKSNAIVVVKDFQALGIGGGQTNRIWPAKQALDRAAQAIAEGAEKGMDDGRAAPVLASDAFFPFADIVESAAAAGVRSIIQPGGSIRDKESIEACDKLGLAMVFTGIRHFKH